MRNKKRAVNCIISLLLTVIIVISGILGFNMPVRADSVYGTITVCVERFSIGQGYLIEPYTMEIQQGDTYEDICRRVLEGKGYSYSAKNSPFYLQGIDGADEGIISIPSCISLIGPKKTGMNTVNPPDNSAVNEYSKGTGWLGEFSYSRMSGWMYSVGNDSGYVFPGVGMAGYTPSDGDVFRLQFTIWGYGEDLTGCSLTGETVYYEVGDKTALTRKIAEINRNKEKWFAVDGCKEAYNQAINCLQKLNATQAELDAALAALPDQEPVFPESITLSETDLTMALGESVKLSATLKPDHINQTGITWKSSDRSVVSVDQNGLVTAKENGRADITATTKNGKTAVCHVTVKERAIEKITLNMTGASMEVEQSIQLLVTGFEPENATEELSLTYKSSNSAVAEVDEAGVVTALKSGTAEITVTTKGGVSAVCRILVGNTVELARAVEDKISLLPDEGHVNDDDTARIIDVWEEYVSLTDAVKAEINAEAVNKLNAIKKEADRLIAKKEDIAKVERLLDELPALSAVTLSDGSQIDAARNAYDALAIDEKAKVNADLYARLLNLERRIAELNKEISEVEKKIQSLSDDVCAENVTEAVKALNTFAALSAEQKDQLNDDVLNKIDKISEKVLKFIADAVAALNQNQTFDENAQMVKDFIAASNACEEMNSNTEAGLSEQTLNLLEQKRTWIGEKIHSVNEISIQAGWFVKLIVNDAETDSNLKNTVTGKYSSIASVVMNKEISFEDIRTGEVYEPEKSIEFSVDLSNKGKLYNPLANMITDHENLTLKELSGKYEGGKLVFKTIHTGSIVIIDNPVAVTGISVPETSSVGIGSSITIPVEYKPANAMINKELKYQSTDTSVVSVSDDGTVKGLLPGTVKIIVSLKSNPSIKAECKVTVTDKANSLTKSVDQILKETSQYMLSIDTNPAKGSEWFVLGLARSGMDLDDQYFSTYYNHIANYLKENDGKLTNTALYTEYSKMILVMTAIGKDPRDIAGYHLFSYLSDFDKVTKQGINGPIWALIALNSREEYEFPEAAGVTNQTTEEKLIAYILEGELSGGGWAMTGDNADPDITGMALQSLAPYYNKNGCEKITAAIDRAVNRLSEIQNSNGGYSTMNAETSESCAQVLTGLCALGIDPMTDARFIKDGHWIVENLISYHIGNSGFMHVKAGAANNGGAEGGTVNGMATEQGYYALTAYQRFTQGKTGLYDMSDISVNKGGSGDNSGTGLEEENNGNNNSSNNGTGNGSGNGDTSGSGHSQTTGSTATKAPAGTSKTVTSSASASKTPGTAKETEEETKESETAEENKGWHFEGEEYQPDQEETVLEEMDMPDNSDINAQDENETAVQKILKMSNIIYFICIIIGIGLLAFCIWKMMKNKKTKI